MIREVLVNISITTVVALLTIIRIESKALHPLPSYVDSKIKQNTHTFTHTDQKSQVLLAWQGFTETLLFTKSPAAAGVDRGSAQTTPQKRMPESPRFYTNIISNTSTPRNRIQGDTALSGLRTTTAEEAKEIPVV